MSSITLTLTPRGWTSVDDGPAFTTPEEALAYVRGTQDHASHGYVPRFADIMGGSQ